LHGNVLQELVWLVKQLMSQHPQLTAHCDVQINWRVFREGIQPLWEDPANAAGGKWAMSFQRRDEHGLYKMCRVLGAVQAAAIPEAEVIVWCLSCNIPIVAVIRLSLLQAVTGVVLSIKNWGCRLSIWVNHIPPANRVSLGVEKLTKLMRPKFISFYSHNGLSERHANVPAKIEASEPVAQAVQTAGSTDAPRKDSDEQTASTMSQEQEEVSDEPVSEAVVSSILSPVPPELLTTKKGSKYTDDIGSFGNWGERSTAGFWVEKSALETSYGAEEDTSTFEVEPCSYAMFDDWNRCGMRMNDSFDWAATATAFQLAGCC
jgi:hypothetical protein